MQNQPITAVQNAVQTPVKWTIDKILAAQNGKDGGTAKGLGVCDKNIVELLSSNERIDSNNHHIDWVVFPCFSTSHPELSFEKSDKDFYKQLSEKQTLYPNILQKYTEEIKDYCEVRARIKKVVQFCDNLPLQFKKTNIAILKTLTSTIQKKYKSLFTEPHYAESLKSLTETIQNIENGIEIPETPEIPVVLPNPADIEIKNKVIATLLGITNVSKIDEANAPTGILNTGKKIDLSTVTITNNPDGSVKVCFTNPSGIGNGIKKEDIQKLGTIFKQGTQDPTVQIDADGEYTPAKDTKYTITITQNIVQAAPQQQPQVQPQPITTVQEQPQVQPQPITTVQEQPQASAQTQASPQIPQNLSDDEIIKRSVIATLLGITDVSKINEANSSGTLAIGKIKIDLNTVTITNNSDGSAKVCFTSPSGLGNGIDESNIQNLGTIFKKGTEKPKVDINIKEEKTISGVEKQYTITITQNIVQAEQTKPLNHTARIAKTPEEQKAADKFTQSIKNLINNQGTRKTKLALPEGYVKQRLSFIKTMEKTMEKNKQTPNPSVSA